MNEDEGNENLSVSNTENINIQREAEGGSLDLQSEQNNQTNIIPQIIEDDVPGTFLKHYFHLSFTNKKIALGAGTLVLIILVLVFAISKIDLSKDIQTESRQYSQTYSFVNEKISKSAAIILSLPKDVSVAEAQKGIIFEPEIKGKWVQSEEKDTLVYKPASSLEPGRYYSVHLETSSLQLTSDFFVDEDPKVEAVFPSTGSEANEHSEITIVFNRPMVPLTTLDELDKKKIPIIISPETEGKFKWISTRNLQFIPKDRLQRSSNYTVTINDGLSSLDGLSVLGASYSFKTRSLRYRNLHSGKTLYNKPIKIYFSQPVDLERTTKEIKVRNTTEKGDVSVEVVYGTRAVFNDKKKEYEELLDRSLLYVYQKIDKHGRKNLWDFKTDYSLTINKAYPLEGDVILNEARSTNIQVADIIESISAKSERSDYVEPELFDPQGELIVVFVEEINLGKSKISAKGLESLRCAEKCKIGEDGYTIYFEPGKCEKKDDKQKIILTFKNDKFGFSENISIDFNKIYNLESLKINASPIIKTITTFPKLSITKTAPVSGAKTASLTEFRVCSNSPLKARSKEEYKDYLITDERLVFNRWGRPYKKHRNNSNNICAIGEYQTTIQYGLIPETEYDLKVKLEDDFGQTNEQNLTFKTTIPEKQYLRFHNLQQTYNVTPSERTKLTYAVENIDFIDLFICKVKPENLLGAISGGDDSSYCLEMKTERIDLPKVYWVNNYFQINIADYFDKTLGHYIITMSNPRYTNYRGELRKERTYLSVTNLAVGEKKVNWSPYSSKYNSSRGLDDSLVKENNNLYWVNDVHSLKPAVGATVSLYSQSSRGKPFVYETTYTADAQGIAEGGVEKRIEGAVVRYLDDSAIVSDWADKLQHVSNAQEGGKTYVYTDRPIYRPGQEVFIRGLDRIGYDGTYEMSEGQKPEIKVIDSRGSIVYKQEVKQTEFGTFSAQFKIPTDAPLGYYRIKVFGRSVVGISVEEYVPAAFKLDIEAEEEEYISGEEMNLLVSADYYFGVPVDGGTVSYSVTSQDYYFDKYTDEYFNFGGGWYYCYWCSYGDEFLFRGTAELDENGKAKISKKIDFDKFYGESEDEQSKIFIINVTVKDSNGRSISAEKSFIVHKSEIYLGVKTNKSFGPKNQDVEVRVKSVNTEGKEVSKKNIVLEINKITWKTFKRREVDGGFYYRSEKEETLIKKETVSTNRKGNYKKSISFSDEGRYEVKVSTTDSLGNTTSGTTNVYVYGDGQVSIRPTNNHSLDIETERSSVSVGDKPKILIQSPFKKAKALITVERGKVFDYSVVDINQSLYDHEILIEEEYSPNVYVSVLLLSSDPEIKFGQLEFNVDTERRELTVDVKPNKNNYLPGEEVKLDVTTRNYLDQPVSAEVSIAVADLSVLALKGNPKKNPLSFFYGGFPLTVSTASNIKNILHEIDIPLGTKGGGGGNPEDLAKKKRGIFKDTAYWNAHVVTGKDGKATLSFTLPDNLTTWQIESLGITKDTLVGTDYDEVLSRKDLMAVPLKPRFVIPGDEFSLGAKIFNQTDKKQKFDVTLSSDTLELVGDMKQDITLSPNTTETIYFDVKAPEQKEKGLHSFVLSAKNSKYEDTVENEISITRNDTYESVATANFTKKDIAKEYVYIPGEVIQDKGGLTINTNATMAVFLSGALDYLVSYPYGCSEQLASKLSSIAVVERGLNIENVGELFELDDITFEGKTYTTDEVVKLGLARLYQNQSYSGGFRYYPRLDPSFNLTLHVVQALNNLKNAGFDISDDSLKRASEFLYAAITSDNRYSKNKDLVILTTFTLSETDTLSKQQQKVLRNRVIGISKDKNYINEDVSSISLAYLAILTAEGYPNSTKSEVFESLENRIDVDGRGAYLKGHVTNNLWQSYETPIKNTALLLKAITAHENEHLLLDKVLRYLLRSRDKDGSWGSTNNTLTTIDAMTDFLSWQRETESDFELVISLDDEEVFEADFNSDTILNTYTKFLPINTFSVNEVQSLTFERTNRNKLRNNFYYDISLKYYLPTNLIPPRDEGITISRSLFSLEDDKFTTPIHSAIVGDVLRGHITITVPGNYNFVSIEDFIPAGFELVNFKLDTEDQSLQYNGKGSIKGKTFATVRTSGNFFIRTWSSFTGLFGKDKQTAQVLRADDSYKYLDEVEAPNRELRPSFEEIHDDRVFLFTERITPGVYEYDYYVRALIPGTFHHLPAIASEMYYPEVFGRTEGNYFTVTTE